MIDYQDPFAEVQSSGNKYNFEHVVEHIRSSSLNNELKEFNFNDFEPFDTQAALYNEIAKREWVKRAFLVFPRRFGKTIFSIVFLIMKSLQKAQTTKLNLIRYGICYPDLSNGKDVAWEAIDHYTKGLPRKSTNKNRGFVTFELTSKYNRSVKVQIQIVGLKDFDTKRGGGFDGIVIDERGFIPDGFKKVLDPMTADRVRQPTFQISIGTPNEANDFWTDYDLFKKKEDRGDLSYFTFWSNYSKLKHITLDEYNRLCESMSTDEVAIELGCERGIITGAKFFSEGLNILEATGRLRDIPSISTVKKSVICDIGGTTQKTKDLFALWFVQYNEGTGRHEFINYLELSSVSPDKIYTAIQELQYGIGQIILPWDGAVGIVSPRKILQDLFPQATVTVLDRVGKLDRIRHGRMFLGKCDFDRKGTVAGYNCLQNYSKEFDKQKRIYLVTPRHDRFSHGADAFCYAAMADARKLLHKGDDFSTFSLQPADTYDPYGRWA